MDEELELLKSVIRTTLNISESDYDAIVKGESEGTVNTEASSSFLKMDKELKVALKGDPIDTKKIRQNGYNEAMSKVLGEHEELIKKTYNIEGDLKGLDLTQALVDKFSKAGTELTDDVVKASPVYQQMMKKHLSEFEESETNWKEKIDGIVKSHERTNVMALVNYEARELINSMNPDFNSDPVVAGNQMGGILSKLVGYDYEKRENTWFVTKDGKIVEDGHGHAVSFEDIVKSEARKLVGFKRSQKRNGVDVDPNKPKPDNVDPVTEWTGRVPENDGEYLAMRAELKTPAERVLLSKAYESRKVTK